jgi:hypothetical protein
MNLVVFNEKKQVNESTASTFFLNIQEYLFCVKHLEWYWIDFIACLWSSKCKVFLKSPDSAFCTIGKLLYLTAEVVHPQDQFEQ